MDESAVLHRHGVGPILLSTVTTQDVPGPTVATSETFKTSTPTTTLPHATSATPSPDTTMTSSPAQTPKSMVASSESSSNAIGPQNQKSGTVSSQSHSSEVADSSIIYSIASTTSATGTTSSTATPSFAWSTISTVLETCTTATLNWRYSGPQETIQITLLPITSLPPNMSIQKRARDNATIAAGVDVTGSRWTWPQVNVPAGQYVVVALGDRVGAVSPPLEIINGTDTSCLVTAPTIPFPNPTPATSKRGGPHGTMLAGAIVAGIAGLAVAIGGYWVWKRSRRREHHSSNASPRRGHGLASFVAARIPMLTEKRRSYPLADVASHPPLMPNRRPPSSLVSAPCTPISLRPQTHAPMTDPFEDISSVRLRSSIPSDAMPTSGRTSTSPSTHLPSYATSLSTPPSYATDAPWDRSASHPTMLSYGNWA